MIPKRTLWQSDLMDDSNGPWGQDRQIVKPEANLVASLGEDGLHYPVFDLDFTAFTVPSSTPGHVHLYLDRGLSWDEYEALLIALGTARLLEPGYVSACIERKASFVRMPWVAKPGVPVSEKERAVADLDTMF